jgi:hypothetical protein
MATASTEKGVSSCTFRKPLPLTRDPHNPPRPTPTLSAKSFHKPVMSLCRISTVNGCQSLLTSDWNCSLCRHRLTAAKKQKEGRDGDYSSRKELSRKMPRSLGMDSNGERGTSRRPFRTMTSFASLDWAHFDPSYLSQIRPLYNYKHRMHIP